VVRAWPFKQLLIVVRGALGRCLLALLLGSNHERGPVSLLVPLFLTRAVGGAFTDILVPLGLASGTVKDRPDRLLA
jgi:hypothetical protein